MREEKERLFVLGLDGVPYEFIMDEMSHLPVIKALLDEGSLVPLRSVVPTLSCVAWASFATGKGPQVHGIWGFDHHDPKIRKTTISTLSHLKAKTLWEILGENGARVILINVPMTFPPPRLNGVVVSGFLAPSLERACHPPDLVVLLKRIGYRIDIDPWKEKERLLDELIYLLEKRFELAFYLLDVEEWDYFQLHVMETDRINHFFWNSYLRGHPSYRMRFIQFYERLDRLIGELLERLRPKRVKFMMLSDHGFTSIKDEINMDSIINGLPGVRSLTTGRIYIDPTSTNYEETKQRIVDLFLGFELKGERVVRRVILPDGEDAPDLLLIPWDGFDLMGGSHNRRTKGIEGTHTFEGAFVYMKGKGFDKEDLCIHDLFPFILKNMGLGS